MSMQYDVKAIFRYLEEDLSKRRAEYRSSQKFIVRQLYTAHRSAFFVAVEPVGLKRIVLLPCVGAISKLEVQRLPVCRGMKITTAHFDRIGSLEDPTCIVVEQTSSETRIFESFADDLCRRVCRTDSEGFLATLKTTLQQWQDFFRKGRSAGLTEEERRGLFGELSVFEWMLDHDLTPDIVDYWKGPLGDSVDFRFGPIGIEVKTTLMQADPHITISSEHQLAPQAGDPLFLAVLFLEPMKSGRCLCDLVESLRTRMKQWPLSLDTLNSLLLQYGYSDLDKDAYEDERYQVSAFRYYHVCEGFPSISPQCLATGIINVHYQIQLSHCSAFQVDEARVLAAVKGALTDGS